MKNVRVVFQNFLGDLCNTTYQVSNKYGQSQNVHVAKMFLEFVAHFRGRKLHLRTVSYFDKFHRCYYWREQ